MFHKGSNMLNNISAESLQVTPLTNRIYRINESCKVLGIGRSTYYKLVAEGVIEPSIKISKRARGHTGAYLQSLIQELMGQS